MADFSDISNWRQEFYEFNERDDEETKEFYNKFNGTVEPLIPVSQVLEFMEVLFQHDELREAVEKRWEWNKVLIAHGNELPDMSDCPDDAFQTLEDFFYYFCWKSNYDAVAAAFETAGIHTLYRILDGEYSNIKSPEVRSHILSKYRNFVSE
ncbi:hypothetical protein [Pseudovibrio sp. Ad37]|uniref:hypothetical protein n=1 Tax=Pseudovibrio sp. Ad37 TaxID=989422 RepID=UPI0007AEBEC1|nr:hypothetical protein [Pseudovibrio sp. Ad37]KZL23840.1 hypothetical protein PsAD37_02954 [Pseudovibrio sp. Ad37]